MKLYENYNFKVLACILCWMLSYLVFLKSSLIPADYHVYKEIYDQTYYKLDDIEVLFVRLTGFFHYLGLSYDGFAMIVCALCLMIKVIVSQKMIENTSGLLFLFVYLCFFAFIHELTQIRTAIATTFFYVALYLKFFRKKTVLPFVLFGVSILFHISSFFIISALYINSRKRFLAVVAGLFFVWISASGYLNILYDYMPNEKIQSYLLRASKISERSGTSLNIFNLNNIIYLFCFLFVHFASKKLNFSLVEQKLIKYVQYSNVIGFLLFYIFDSVPVIAFRLPELLRVTYPLVLILVVSKLNEIKRNSIMIMPILMLVSALMCFITIRAITLVSI